VRSVFADIDGRATIDRASASEPTPHGLGRRADFADRLEELAMRDAEMIAPPAHLPLLGDIDRERRARCARKRAAPLLGQRSGGVVIVVTTIVSSTRFATGGAAKSGRAIHTRVPRSTSRGAAAFQAVPHRASNGIVTRSGVGISRHSSRFRVGNC
jgi:hypothetical protein